MAEDAELVALLSAADPRQRRPSLLFASVHYLLLSGVEDELARWYPSVSGETIAAEDPVPAFRRFCRKHRERLADVVAEGKTQTNDVRRCSALIAGLGVAAQTFHGRSLALIELGSSAGLNLLFDRYFYRLGDQRIGDPQASVHIDTETTGRSVGRTQQRAHVEVPWRLGIDLDPPDLRDPDAVNRLRACVWPEQRAELARLDAAIALALAFPPPLASADAVTDLRRIAEEVPSELPLCLFHSTLVTYLPPDARTELFTTIRDLASRRPVMWIYLESPALMTGPGAPEAITSRHRADHDTFALGVVGPEIDAVLARVGTYGEFIAWQA